ncbi:cytochrome P450 [Amycolatopsis jiangsuensis]|uniref:Cytochrome P450 n=1 Tax=Amycolatopsis jiangsuensis TaxID=1181879 RepID=A0A840IYN8_9PSEU|nr:cytochrome P450 [Amycolatopsis jiangsuensis]MBB4686258.1 cytochrome P450 [Amycolatopsis jiangsuensis]
MTEVAASELAGTTPAGTAPEVPTSPTTDAATLTAVGTSEAGTTDASTSAAGTTDAGTAAAGSAAATCPVAHGTGRPEQSGGDAVEPEPADFPLVRSCPFAPPPEYREYEQARAKLVELPSGQRAWVLAKYEDVRAMLNDPRFSSDRFNPGYPILFRDGAQRRRTNLTPSLINLDPPVHGPARREVVGEFTVKRMKALQPRIQEIVDTHLDAILAGNQPADLVTALSLPVPSLVICEQLGVPYADHDFFQQHSSMILNRDVKSDERADSVEALQDYLSELVSTKEAAPTDDLLGRQIEKKREEGTYDHDDLVSLAFLLLIAGHETTANMISLGTVALLRNLDQLALIKEDPGKTLDAVEELLRYFTIAEFATSRVAREDVEIAGVTIREGEGVLGLSHAADFDETVFPEPDRIDITRGGRHHVAFGFGAHQCLGQNLARMELQIVFDTLFRRIPTLRLAVPFEQLPFKHDSSIFGLHCLPVTW